MHTGPRAGDQVGTTATGPWWPANLRVPYVALLLIRDALDEIVQVKGDVPGVPGVDLSPEGPSRS